MGNLENAIRELIRENSYGKISSSELLDLIDNVAKEEEIAKEEAPAITPEEAKQEEDRAFNDQMAEYARKIRKV